MRSVKKVLCLAVAFIMLISTGSAIVEHVRAETVERMKMPPVLQSTGDEGNSTSGIESGFQPEMTLPQPLPAMQVVKPSIPYTIMVIRNREYIVASWLDENTQIILLYHDMDEPMVRARTNQWFTGLDETAIRTIPT